MPSTHDHRQDARIRQLEMKLQVLLRRFAVLENRIAQGNGALETSTTAVEASTPGRRPAKQKVREKTS